MVFLCGAEFRAPRVARGIKGRGPRLTFDLKRALKMKPEKLELESTHPETLDLYTHIKKVRVAFLIDNQHNHVVFISMYTPMAATQ